MTEQRVTVLRRTESPVHGFTTVTAMVNDGASGEYSISSNLGGTPLEIEEILAQSIERGDLIKATRAGQD